MTTVMDKFDDYWSGGDPVIKNRFFIKTINPMLWIVSSYVLFVKVIGPYIMRNRKPVQMRPLMIVYNFSLVAFYVWFLLKGAYFLYVLRLSLFCGSLSRNGHPIVADIFTHAYILYVVRFIELLDTVFLVISKKYKMVTSLHVFHHAIVPVFGWFGFRSETSGYLAIFMGVNCFVHVLMYFYYAIAALGPKYHKYIWWKKYLTSLQILQFFVMTIYMNIMYAFGCVESLIVFVFSNFLSVLFFFLFINYYRGAYQTTAKKIEEQKKDVIQSNGMKKENGILKSSGAQKNGGLPVAYRNAIKKKE